MGFINDNGDYIDINKIDKTKNKYYVWTQGSKRGLYEKYSCENDEYVYFTSGNFILRNDTDTKLREISEEEYNANVNVNESIKQSKVDNLIPTNWNNIALNNPDELIGEMYNNNLNDTVIEVQKKVEENPIELILKKNKKVDKEIISINLEYDIPSFKVIDLLTTMFEEDEVYDIIIKNLLNKYSYKVLQEHIKENLKEKLSEIIDKNNKI